jgi:hypothetical protein
VGHVIFPEGSAEPFVVQRTNNLSEHLFGRTKQGLRRKVGTKNLTRYIQAMRPEELLVANLNDPRYLEIICGGSLENLAASFAKNWQAGQSIRAKRREKKSHHPIPMSKKSLREEGFLPCLKRAIATAIQQTSPKERAA